MKALFWTILVATALLFQPFSALAIDITDTRLLTDPAISNTHIAFIYAEDLWVADRNGSNPRRLTADRGVESHPEFSPDGSMIAFSAQYDGNTDVFVVPVTGGVPKRLTWHPSADLVRGFTPDGRQVLFASQRATHTNRYLQLYTVDVTTGVVTALPVPNAFWASYNPGGTHIAYTPIPDRYRQWKNYRGGTMSKIWVYDVNDHSVVEIPKPPGGSNDSEPVWVGNQVYFVSDRAGEFNLFRFNRSTGSVEQLTRFDDFAVMNLAANGTSIIFEQAGYLHVYDTSQNRSQKITIGIATDLLEHRPRFVSGSNYVRSASVSPSGARVAVNFRGEIVTVPAKKGDPLNITRTPGAHEKFPAWSPDGRHIAYFSDAGGEYALFVHPLNGDAAPTIIPLDGAGFYAYINWAPDSKKVAYVDNSRSLYITDIASGRTTKVAEDAVYVPGVFRQLFGCWSSDATWLSYTRITETNFERAYVYSVSENTSYPVSDGLSNVTSPVFDPSGKYLYMLASTDAGPVVNWFDLSNQDMRMSNSMYLLTLRKDVPSPFAREQDEEVIEAPAQDPQPTTRRSARNNRSDTGLVIDWDGIENRIIPVPVPAGMYRSLQVPKEGMLYYLAQNDRNGPSTLYQYDISKRKAESVMPASYFEIAAKGDKTLYQNQGIWGIADTGKKPDADAALNTGQISVKIEPLAEWPNIFNEAWRVNRDYYYDPGMHGADWDAMKKKYEVFLPHLATKQDLYRVMEWMFSELAVGHHRFSSTGDRLHSTETIPGGLLGADYTVENGRYRISRIYGGLNWTPDLRSPLTEPGVNVSVGDYILAVNGKPLTAADNFFSFFENTANKRTEIMVSPTTRMADARKVVVTPIASESALRNRFWVEDNLKKVHEATNGRVAYVYVPNTTTLGHEYFKRYFFPQADKDAIIVDERFNGGGQLADYYIDILKRPVQSYWNYRYGKDQKAPNASIQGPKVMIIDETAGSGGDYLPYLFRKNNLGTLVGKTTWGGLVGILGFPEFIDGGSVTAPNLAFYDERGFAIENVGVPPDIEVEQWPAAVIGGRDPQLEKAIELVMEQLKANPPKTIGTPPYPVRVRQ